MRSVTESPFTDGDLAGLLLAMGAEPPVGPHVFGDSFQELGLDSLARTQIAEHVAERWGVDVEARLTPETTPEDLRRFVTEAARAARAQNATRPTPTARTAGTTVTAEAVTGR